MTSGDGVTQVRDQGPSLASGYPLKEQMTPSLHLSDVGTHSCVPGNAGPSTSGGFGSRHHGRVPGSAQAALIATGTMERCTHADCAMTPFVRKNLKQGLILRSPDLAKPLTPRSPN